MRLPVLLLVAALGCSREQGSKPEGPEPMGKEERERGLQLCEGWVTRVCTCADKDATLRDPCDLARSQPEALRMPLALLDGAEGALNDRERRMTEAAARKIIAGCVKADAALPLDRCARP